MFKQKAELEQYKNYCQEYYEELNSKSEPELKLQSKVSLI